MYSLYTVWMTFLGLENFFCFFALFLIFLCWLLLRASFYAFLAKKKRTYFPYFKISLKKVQSIHCLNDLFGARKIVFIFCSVFDFFLLVPLQRSILRIFSPKKRNFFLYFKKSLKKVQSIHCLNDLFGARKIFIYCDVFDFFFLWFLFRASFYAFLAQKTAPFFLISKSH